MTSVTLSIDSRQVEAEQNTNILSIFREHGINVNQICGGQGMCASCHFFVVSGSDALTPTTHQEQMTLQYTNLGRPNARLACQTRVIGNGVVIELPKGTFVESERDLEVSIGKKATQTLIHPLTGEILVEEGKLILRSAIEKMQAASDKFAKALSANK
jgi:ferredoxin